jgi:hypothetical protein
MLTIVLLSPEELAIARLGELPEPSFRPFPGSAREREMEARSDNEWETDLAVEKGASNPNTIAVTLEERLVDRELPRLGAAQRWTRSSRAHSLLVERDGTDLRVIGLGTVEGSSRPAIRGVRQLVIRVRYLFDTPIDLAEIRSALTTKQQTLLDSIANAELRPLPPALSAEVRRVVLSIAPELDEIFQAVQASLNAETLARARARTRHDAVLPREAAASALHFFAPARHKLTPELEPSPSGFAVELETLAGSNEDDYVSDDASIFPGWDRSTYSRGGWWEFRSKQRRLLIKNINVSPQEGRTGADLVYVRRNPDAFVLVQYKVLETLSSGELIFRPETRLSNQIQRMQELERQPRGDVPPDAFDTYRLGHGFSFVKFVVPAATQQGQPGELTPGYYFPGEYARRVLLRPDSGPNGGLVHYLTRHRHLTSDTFARLVRDSWVGSTGDATAILRDIFQLRDTSADIVLAVEEPAQEDSPEQSPE